MKRQARKQNLVAEINITPFTDVILVLLVIFMITTPLISEMRMKVNLPEAKSGKPVEGSRPEQIDITITYEGPLYVNGKIASRKDLKRQLATIHSANPDVSVVIHSDKFVKFQEIVNVLDNLSELGITRIDVAATTED